MAGEILSRHGVRGTYYTSLGLMDEVIPAGAAFGVDDLDVRFLPLIFRNRDGLRPHPVVTAASD